MTADDPRWRQFPILREFHDQWWRARGGRLDESARPFTRAWEQLLEDAGLVSAELRAEAERDARLLTKAGLLRLKVDKYRSHLIERVLLPVEAEPRLAKLFGDPTENAPTGPDPATVAWEPELEFLRTARATVALDDLIRLNRFLTEGGRARPVVPIKERSLEIFGDEKRLDALLVTVPFRTGSISLATLRCFQVAEPLGWRRGSNPAGSVLVIENLATWDSYARWNEQTREFSALVYGKGFVFIDAVARLTDIVQEIGGPRPVEYFGDLDPTGVEIPYRASTRWQALGHPAITPHRWSYQRLLEVEAAGEGAWDGDPVSEEALRWLGDLAEPVRRLFQRGHRLAQEHVGWEVLLSSRTS